MTNMDDVDTEELTDLAVMGLGSGLKGLVVGYVKDYLPDVTEDVAALIAGGAMWYFGERVHPAVKTLGAGILIGAIGQIAKAKMPAIGGGGTETQSSPGPQQAPTLEMLAAMEAGM